MGGEDCRIERFIFPDGGSVDVMVFEHRGTSTAAGHAADRSAGRAARASSSRDVPAAPGGAPAASAPAAPAPVRSAPPAATPARPVPRPCCAPPPSPQDEEEAHTCPVCGSELVYPVDWDRAGPSSWTLVLRCPECETRREVILGRASVEHLNRELYSGAQALARDADQMTRRNFEEEAERIVALLDRDLILPMDF